METPYSVYVNNNSTPYVLDESGYELFNKHNWFSTGGNYKYLRTKVKKGNEYLVLKFHIELMKDEIIEYAINNSDTRIIVDHISGDIYDNRKSNLRVRTQSENNMNKKIQKNNTTGIVGVSWHSRDRLWQSFISVGNERIHLGSFYYFRNAVKARIDAEKTYFKEHAYYLRDENYFDLINSIINMENMNEPIITAKRGRYNVNGVSKFRNKFRARITKDNIEESSLHENLESAIAWRKNKELEIYGSYLIFKEDMLEKQI